MPGKSRKPFETKVIKSKYSSSSRGKKETFRGRKETIFRKCHELSELQGARYLSLIYQPHRKKYHLCYDQRAPKSIWPFDVEKFAHEQYPAVSINNVAHEDRSAVNALQQPPAKSNEVSDRSREYGLSDILQTSRSMPYPPASSTSPSGLLITRYPSRDDYRRPRLLIKAFTRLTFKRYELTLSPLFPPGSTPFEETGSEDSHENEMEE